MDDKLKRISQLWFEYNKISKSLADEMGGTNNIVGEFAEKIVCSYYNVKQAPPSTSSYDLITNNKQRVQVKSRKLSDSSDNLNTQLSVIRSWEFDILAVILFSANGNILQAITIKKDYAKEYAKENKHQHGWIISTTQDFLNDRRATDITGKLREIIS